MMRRLTMLSIFSPANGLEMSNSMWELPLPPLRLLSFGSIGMVRLGWLFQTWLTIPVILACLARIQLLGTCPLKETLGGTPLLMGSPLEWQSGVAFPLSVPRQRAEHNLPRMSKRVIIPSSLRAELLGID